MLFIVCIQDLAHAFLFSNISCILFAQNIFFLVLVPVQNCLPYEQQLEVRCLEGNMLN